MSKSSKCTFLFSGSQIYDFLQPAGPLIVAESTGTVQLITDYGQTKTSLPNLPSEKSKFYACMVFVNRTTVFLAGGQSEYQHTASFPAGADDYIIKIHLIHTTSGNYLKVKFS